MVAASNYIGNSTPGWGTTYAQLVAPYQKMGGHERFKGHFGVSGGLPWFNPASFANPAEPGTTTATNPSNVSPVLPNTHRNEFRGPGTSVFNANLFKGFHVYRESEFQIRFEAFNIFNHALLYNNPNATVGGGTFGYITSFGPAYSVTQGSRSLQFGGRFLFEDVTEFTQASRPGLLESRPSFYICLLADLSACFCYIHQIIQSLRVSGSPLAP